MYNQYNLMMKSEGKRKLFKTLNHNGQDINIYKHKDFELESIPAKIRTEEYYIRNFEFIVRKDSQQQESSLEQLIMSNIQKNDTLFSVERVLKQGKNKGVLNKSYYMNDNVIYHLKKYAEVIDKAIFRKVDMNNLWLDYEVSSAGISEEGSVKLKRGKKPEQLIKRIIEIGANDENDIILDYHIGSGTTCAVAHKMGRQYIGVEQLDYGDNDSIVRLKNVIKGDASGISKTINWKGGGEMVYLELKKHNQTFIEQIESAKDTKAILKIWEEMKTKSFLNYNVDLQKQETHIEEFKTLALGEQKKHLIELLDKNQLYVNLTSLNDKDFDVSAGEKKVTKDFYKIK
jgi:adenine-specific DNA-methyltransferase